MLIICRSHRRLALLAGVLVSLPFLLGQGCPATGGSGGVPVVALDFPNLDRAVAVGEQVTMVYDATDATSVRAFYDHDGRANTGDEVVFRSNLPAGTNQVTQLATTNLPTGLYYVGVSGSSTAGSATAYATGRITIVGNAVIAFLSPATDVTVGPGISVPVRFDAGLTDFTYRLFYDRDGTFNGNEVTITQGPSGGTSLIDKSFDTSALASGTYYVGVAVTTSVGSSVTEYATGRVVIVTGVYVQVLAPTIGLRATVGDSVQVVVAANDPANPDVMVRIFYDPDSTYGNGNETSINVVPASSGGTVWNTTGVLEGQYYVGAQLQNGLTPPIVSYSAGPAELAPSTGGGSGGGGAGTFLLGSPSADVRLYEGTDTEIRWFADTSVASGTLSLYRVLDQNNTGVLDPGAEQVLIVSGLSPTLRTYTMSTTGLTGAYFIVGKLTAPNATVYTSSSKGRVIVRPPLYWVGGLNTDRSFQGCTLRGFNFQDLAGYAFLPAGDVDGDGIDDFVSVSPFAKPGLVNPSGVGYGEAYLVFGNRIRLTGSYDLNRTGYKPAATATPTATSATDGLDQGVIFSGVAVPAGTTNISGISSACMVPDMDDDGNNELIFGIAKADSLRLRSQNIGVYWWEGLLENDHHFLRGGIVVVASTNSILRARNAVSRDQTRVIRLQEVGQVFSGSCDPIKVNCSIKGSCGVEPCMGQAFMDGTPDDSDDACNTYDYSSWSFPGFFYSWTYPALSVPVWLCPASSTTTIGMFRGGNEDEPYGCRILGQALEDGSTLPDSRFGTAVSAIRSDTGRHLILVSAPNQSPDTFDVPELSATRSGAGVVYAIGACNYWDYSDTTPVSVSRPHQYIVKTAGYETSHVVPHGTADDLIRRPFYVVGPTDDAHIESVAAIPDFNRDGRMDFIVGSPNETGGAGAAYIIFRRPSELEGNYLLEKLALSPTEPTRLNGVMVRGESGDRLGEVVSGAGDYNGDGHEDVLIGLPNHRTGRGAVLIIYSRQDLVSPAGGFTIDNLVAQGYAALLVGANVGDLTGFNVANAGDVDGDGKDDLLIAAPSASPKFDSNGDGSKDAIGLDFNGDRVADDLTNSGQSTDLERAGLVYLVKGSNTLVGEVSLSLLGTEDLSGFAFVGRAKDYRLGGGTSTLGLGARSRGLSTAGDIDSDGRKDILLGSMLASPESKTHAGECYLIYGGIQP